MVDLSLSDLAGGSTPTDEGDAGEDTAESGESLMELIEFMDDRGYLGPIVFGSNDDTHRTNRDDIRRSESHDDTDDSGDDGTVPDPGDPIPLTADTIVALSQRIQSEVGDVPISKIEAYAEHNPEEVNSLIQQL